MAHIKDLNGDEFYFSDFLVTIGDDIVRRVTKKDQDFFCVFSGKVGSGKSNGAINLGYYCSQKSGRPFSVDNIFFDINNLVEFASKTKDQIIIWDEAALGGMGVDWRNKTQKMLLKLLMVCRKKHHIMIFCIPDAMKLNEYLILQRANCLFHVYEDDKTEVPGNWIMVGESAKEKLYARWKKTRINDFYLYFSYKKFPVSHFTYRKPQLIDDVAYEAKKDVAIEGSIEDKDVRAESMRTKFNNRFKRVLTNVKLNFPELTQEQLGKLFEMDQSSISKVLRAEIPKESGLL